MPESYKPEVQVAGGDGKWSGNATRFATHDEAEQYVNDLMLRWTSVVATRVIESTDPITTRWSDGHLTWL